MPAKQRSTPWCNTKRTICSGPLHGIVWCGCGVSEKPLRPLHALCVAALSGVRRPFVGRRLSAALTGAGLCLPRELAGSSPASAGDAAAAGHGGPIAESPQSPRRLSPRRTGGQHDRGGARRRFAIRFCQPWGREPTRRDEIKPPLPQGWRGLSRVLGGGAGE